MMKTATVADLQAGNAYHFDDLVRYREVFYIELPVYHLDKNEDQSWPYGQFAHGVG